ncbi:MAG: heat-inducible transcriptional repressor HrcA [Mollicutes bacterium PWAP]|nr:heat-inducible transcriptional repressor HrcA [Mollicutes bacterium PWAP]
MTDRQKRILKMSIEFYIKNAIPISSSKLIKEYDLSISSATIRNELNTLEKEGLIIKAYSSSGRVPSKKGYKYFAEELTESKKNKEIEIKLNSLLLKRTFSIENTINEAIRTVSEVTGLTIISSNKNNELMKNISLTPINEKLAIIVIVTSLGKVESKLVNLSEEVKLKDVRIVVRLFKDRLTDTLVTDLVEKMEIISPIIYNEVSNYEKIIQEFATKVFNSYTKINSNNVYGNTNIIKRNEIDRKQIVKLFDLIENKSIWETIEGNANEEESLKIDIRKNASIFSKRFDYKENLQKEISIIGSNRIDYSEAKGAIETLEEFIKNINKK